MFFYWGCLKVSSGYGVFMAWHGGILAQDEEVYRLPPVRVVYRLPLWFELPCVRESNTFYSEEVYRPRGSLGISPCMGISSRIVVWLFVMGASNGGNHKPGQDFLGS